MIFASPAIERSRREERVNDQVFQRDWGTALVIRCVIVIMADVVSHMTRNDQQTHTCAGFGEGGRG